MPCKGLLACCMRLKLLKLIGVSGPKRFMICDVSFSMDDILEKVKVFADQAHGEQLRKYVPDRYIVHPLRVMGICREYNAEVTMLSAALLHDVLEDTTATPADLKSFLTSVMPDSPAERTLQLVIELTDVYTKADYPHLNRRKRKVLEAERLALVSPAAQTIKYADILDNASDIIQHDKSFAMVYIREALQLLGYMKKGNADLYDRTLKTLKKLRSEMPGGKYNS